MRNVANLSCNVFAVLIVALFALQLYKAPAHAASTAASTVALLQQAYDSQCDALLRSDYHAWSASMMPNLAFTTATGERKSREELLHDVEESAQKIKWTTCSATIRALWESEGNVNVVVTNHASGSLEANSRAIPIKTDGDSIDVWATLNGEVKQSSSTDINASLTIDGKVTQLSRLPPPRRSYLLH